MATAPRVQSVPLEILNESINAKVKVVLLGGESLYGYLDQVDAVSMNLHLSAVHAAGADGKPQKLDRVVVRGSMVKWVSLPPRLRSAPIITATLRRVAARAAEQRPKDTAGAAESRKRPRGN